MDTAAPNSTLYLDLLLNMMGLWCLHTRLYYKHNRRKPRIDKHINATIDKANSMFSIIRRSFQILCQISYLFLNHLYTCILVHVCHLYYSSSVWSPYKQKYMDALQNLQKWAARNLPLSVSKLLYEECICILKLPTLTYRAGDMIKMCTIMNETNDTSITTCLKVQSADGTCPRGHTFQLCIEWINKNIRKGVRYG
jgi:hypothetical protein